MELKDEDIKELLKQAALEGVKEYKRQETQDKYAATFRTMKNYRDAVYIASNNGSSTEELKKIQTALAELKDRREAAGREVEYKAFEMYFTEGLSYMTIADVLNTGKNTPRRWVTQLIQELSTLLYGANVG